MLERPDAGARMPERGCRSRPNAGARRREASAPPTQKRDPRAETRAPRVSACGKRFCVDPAVRGCWSRLDAGARMPQRPGCAAARISQPGVVRHPPHPTRKRDPRAETRAPRVSACGKRFCVTPAVRGCRSRPDFAARRREASAPPHAETRSARRNACTSCFRVREAFMRACNAGPPAVRTRNGHKYGARTRRDGDRKHPLVRQVYRHAPAS